MKLSPMMQHYVETKKDYEDCILFYRLGDFYEMFFEDAEKVSRELELTLTGKSCGLEEKAPMCGVPFKAADSYIAKLVERGYKVAICEQVEDPKETKGIVKREVIKIVTPGTVMSGELLVENENNYLASVYLERESIAISYCDISTGELSVTEETGKNAYQNVLNHLAIIDAKEIIINENADKFYPISQIEKTSGCRIETKGENFFSEKAGEEMLKSILGPGAIASSGLIGRYLSIKSIGALLSYLLDTQKQALKQITRCNFHSPNNHMSLDQATLRNLEITRTLYENRRQGSLLGVLDKTCTAMGSRLMKKWLREPLNNSAEINKRLDGVEVIFEDPLLENNLREFLKTVYDFERLATRIASGSANGKDMVALKKSLMVLPSIKHLIEGGKAPILEDINNSLYLLTDICEKIDRAISDDAPYTIMEGNLIKPGFSEELDALKDSIKDAKEWIKNLEVTEKERTGLKNLKVGYNKVFGYYIDVPRSVSDKVPENYIRKQTLVNNERYITPELKETENLVMNAETKINRLEYDIFCALRAEIEEYIWHIQETASAISVLDVLTSFAYVAGKNGYVRPIVDDSLDLILENGRHPVVEKTEDAGMFIANDTELNGDDKSFMVITGPNMSGKSTFMRQTALIVLMAQVGCPVPCDYAKIGVVDRIFTRIGASDNLSKGQSTFYLEMSELSYILNCATNRSLIILDEIGRGTSTYDGLAIAWATIEYLCNEEKHIRTLFATHYHELTDLEENIRGIKNLNVDVAEIDGNIVFLHKIVEGSASRSYGVHVAKIAGAPKKLLDNAEKKLALLEKSSQEDGRIITDSKDNKKSEEKDNRIMEQLTLFENNQYGDLVNKIKETDLMNITPAQAIALIEELKGMV